MPPRVPSIGFGGTWDAVVRTLAGTNLAESVDGLAAYARFYNPSGIAISADGDTLYVAQEGAYSGNAAATVSSSWV